MDSQHDSPKFVHTNQIDLVREAEVLLEMAIELHRQADEATERARAAMARIGRPMPLFDRLGDDDGEGR